MWKSTVRPEGSTAIVVGTLPWPVVTTHVSPFGVTDLAKPTAQGGRLDPSATKLSTSSEWHLDGDRLCVCASCLAFVAGPSRLTDV
jgi:hypothetical protein